MENKMILASPRASGKFTLNVDALGRPELDPHSVGGLESSTDPDCVLAVMPEGMLRDPISSCTAAPALCKQRDATDIQAPCKSRMLLYACRRQLLGCMHCTCPRCLQEHSTCTVLLLRPDEPLSPSQHGISFDDALTKYVGEFGKGQVRRGCRVTVAEPSLAAAKSRWC
eukprot:GHUV01048565.1.p1 GENE.GHUV01048565.1~~GHUV01048565.1.p1  ORF type:complete len:169 (+),score=6.96 GHUV01048565.1:775-1281(+)